MLEESGIFLVDKEEGLTSHDVLNAIKRKFNVKKIGHAGTLDPMATGLLVVLINQATKISDILLNEEKGYEFTVKLFVETDSLDMTGTIVKEETPFKLNKLELKKVIDKYDGYIYDQEPPIFSAIKVNGKKMLDYALDNTISDIGEIKKRTIKIKQLNMLRYDKKTNEIDFSIVCSKGTYVRSLARDIAKELNTIGSVSKLRRVQSGLFDIKKAKKISDLKENEIINLYDTLTFNGFSLVNYHNIKEILNGSRIELINVKENLVFIIDKKSNVLAMYERVARDIFACKRGLWDEKNVKQ